MGLATPKDRGRWNLARVITGILNNKGRIMVVYDRSNNLLEISEENIDWGLLNGKVNNKRFEEEVKNFLEYYAEELNNIIEIEELQGCYSSLWVSCVDGELFAIYNIYFPTRGGWKIELDSVTFCNAIIKKVARKGFNKNGNPNLLVTTNKGYVIYVPGKLYYAGWVNAHPGEYMDDYNLIGCKIV